MKRAVLATIVRAWAEAAPGCYLVPCESLGIRAAEIFDVVDPSTGQPFASLIIADEVSLDAMEDQPPAVQARLDAAVSAVRKALKVAA